MANPFFMDEYNRQQEQALMGVNKGSGQINPIQYFGRYTLPDPTSAANFIQSPVFMDFWDRQKVGKENVGIRSEINDSGRFNSPRPRWDYNKELAYYEGIRDKALAKPENFKGEHDWYKANLERQKVQLRAAGRFYTQQGSPMSANNTSFYLDQWNSRVDGGFPVRVIADDRLSKFSLAGRTPFNGNIPEYPNQIGVPEALEKNRSMNYSRTVGTDLGASLSSQPDTEAFVSSQMANKARLAGKVNADRTVTLIGMPKTSVPMQVAGNVIQGAGTFMNYAGIIPLATSELERKRSDYQNPVTQEYFTKDKVMELDGITYDSATPQQIAMFHPDNADEHPEITDEMRKKFYPKWFK